MAQMINLRTKLAGISLSGNYMFSRDNSLNESALLSGRPVTVRHDLIIGRERWTGLLCDAGIIKEDRTLDTGGLLSHLNSVPNMEALLNAGLRTREMPVSNRTLFSAVTGRLVPETDQYFSRLELPQPDSLDNIPCGISVDIPGPVAVSVRFSPDACAAGLTQELAERISGIIARKYPADLKENGRSFSFEMPNGSALHHGENVFGTAIAKGVTYQGRPPEMSRYFSPKGALVSQAAQHLIYGPDGLIESDFHPPYPKGGIYLYQAITEYLIMRHAFFSGVPCPYTIGIGTFPELTFNGLPLGFVIKTLESEDVRYGTYINARFVNAGKSNEPIKNILKRLVPEYSDYARRSATTLFALNSAGITHSEPHPDNFGLPRNGICTVHDMTSSRLICQLSQEEFAARLFEDFIAGCKSVVEGCDASVVNINLKNLGMSAVPVERFVKGYFEKADKKYLSSGTAKKAVGRMNIEEFLDSTHAIRGRFQGKRLTDIANPLIPLFVRLAGDIYSDLAPYGRRAK